MAVTGTCVVEINELICRNWVEWAIQGWGRRWFFFGEKVDVPGRGIGDELIDSREIDRIFRALISSPSIKTARSSELYLSIEGNS